MANDTTILSVTLPIMGVLVTMFLVLYCRSLCYIKKLKKQQGVMRRMTPPSYLHHAPADDGRSRLSSAFVVKAPPSPLDSRRHTTTQTICPKFMPTLHVTDSHLLVATQALDTGTHLMPTTQVFNAHLLPTTQAPNTNLPSIRRSWSMYHVENQEVAAALLPLHHHPLKASKYGFRTVPHRKLTKIYDNYEEMFPDPTKPPPPKSFKSWECRGRIGERCSRRAVVTPTCGEDTSPPPPPPVPVSQHFTVNKQPSLVPHTNFSCHHCPHAPLDTSVSSPVEHYIVDTINETYISADSYPSP